MPRCSSVFLGAQPNRRSLAGEFSCVGLAKCPGEWYSAMFGCHHTGQAPGHPSRSSHLKILAQIRGRMSTFILEFQDLDGHTTETVMLEGENPAQAFRLVEEKDTSSPVKLFHDYRGREFLGEIQRDRAGIWHIFESNRTGEPR